MDAYLQAGFDALGDATRMAIFERLSSGPMAVNELAELFPVSRPAVSQHLRVLKDAGLVSDRKAGTRRVYELSPEGIARLRAHFDKVWDRAMRSFQAVAESGPKSKSESKSKDKRKGENHGKGRRRDRRT